MGEPKKQFNIIITKSKSKKDQTATGFRAAVEGSIEKEKHTRRADPPEALRHACTEADNIRDSAHDLTYVQQPGILVVVSHSARNKSKLTAVHWLICSCCCVDPTYLRQATEREVGTSSTG